MKFRAPLELVEQRLDDARIRGGEALLQLLVGLGAGDVLVVLIETAAGLVQLVNGHRNQRFEIVGKRLADAKSDVGGFRLQCPVRSAVRIEPAELLAENLQQPVQDALAHAAPARPFALAGFVVEAQCVRQQLVGRGELLQRRQEILVGRPHRAAIFQKQIDALEDDLFVMLGRDQLVAGGRAADSAGLVVRTQRRVFHIFVVAAVADVDFDRRHPHHIAR